MKAQLKKERHRDGYGPALSPSEEQVKKDREMRENVDEKDIDKTSEDSFPASDPPARY